MFENMAGRRWWAGEKKGRKVCTCHFGDNHFVHIGSGLYGARTMMNSVSLKPIVHTQSVVANGQSVPGDVDDVEVLEEIDSLHDLKSYFIQVSNFHSVGKVTQPE
jgi:hypothetical protein